MNAFRVTIEEIEDDRVVKSSMREVAQDEDVDWTESLGDAASEALRMAYDGRQDMLVAIIADSILDETRVHEHFPGRKAAIEAIRIAAISIRDGWHEHDKGVRADTGSEQQG